VNKIRRVQSTTSCKVIFILAAIFFFGVSCTKEYSFEGTIAPGTVSIFATQIPEGQTFNDQMGGIELGVRFRSTIAGYVKGIKFYKTQGNSGIHTGQLYSFDGTLLGSAVFTNETDSGWQTVLFNSDVLINANTTYIAAYHSSLGNYTSTIFGFDTAVNNPPLTALADGADGINGLYKYTTAPAFPGIGYNSSNYWVDVLVAVHVVE